MQNCYDSNYKLQDLLMYAGCRGFHILHEFLCTSFRFKWIVVWSVMLFIPPLNTFCKILAISYDCPMTMAIFYFIL